MLREQNGLQRAGGWRRGDPKREIRLPGQQWAPTPHGAREDRRRCILPPDERQLAGPLPEPSSRRFSGRGPKRHICVDARIHEDGCDRFIADPFVDATDIDVRITDGEITFGGRRLHFSNVTLDGRTRHIASGLTTAGPRDGRDGDPAGGFHVRAQDGRFAEARGLRTEAGLGARGLVEMASAEWQLGDRARAKAMAVEASQLSHRRLRCPLGLAAVLAQVGETGRARLLIARLAADQPKDTVLNSVWVLLTESSLALGENKPDVAIEALRPAERDRRRWPQVAFQRGLAYEAATSPRLSPSSSG